MDWDPQKQLEETECVCDTEPSRDHSKCVFWVPRAAKRYACVITTAVVMEEGARTQKILAHAGLTLDPERLVPPYHPLPPFPTSCQPFFLHLLSTPVPSSPLWGSSLTHMEVWASSWLSAKKRAGGRGLDEGEREGSIENGKIDLIYLE